MQIHVTLTEAQVHLLQQMLAGRETLLADIATSHPHRAEALPAVREVRQEIDFALLAAARSASQARQSAN